MLTQEAVWYIIIIMMMINIPVYLKETLSNVMINCESLSLNSIGFFNATKGEFDFSLRVPRA